MKKERDFTQGKILSPLLRFMLPVLSVLFRQSLYGAMDLLKENPGFTSESDTQ